MTPATHYRPRPGQPSYPATSQRPATNDRRFPGQRGDQRGARRAGHEMKPPRPIHVLSASELEATTLPLSQCTLISIAGFAAEHPPRATEAAHVLRLNFADVPEDRDIFRAATAPDIRAALAFAARHRSKPLIVCCRYGLSRSPAVAWLVAVADGASPLGRSRASGTAKARLPAEYRGLDDWRKTPGPALV